MGKLKGLPTLLVIVAVVWLLIRAVHLLLPVIKPEVLPGPFFLDHLSEVEPVTGFSARLPLYHPEPLGTEPTMIRASRSPEREVMIVWRNERFLELVERPSDSKPFDAPADAEGIDDHSVLVWNRGEVVCMTTTLRGIHLSLRTDLSREDALRIVSTMVPLEEVR